MRSTKELRSARAAIFIGAILTVLAAAAIFFVMHMGDNKNLSERERQALAQTLYFPNPSENQQIGETESIVNNDPDHAVSIHYPVFGIQAIDLQVLEVVEDLQKGHRNSWDRSSRPLQRMCNPICWWIISLIWPGTGLPPWYSR